MKRIWLNVLAVVVLSGAVLRAQSIDGDWTLQTPTESLRPIVQIAQASQTAPPKPMAADADPSFEVATIRPSDPAATDVGFRVGGRKFSVLSTSLNVLIQWAYGVQEKQIVGGPDWLDNDKCDIVGVPDKEGKPSSAQWKMMTQKLLADRFKLTFHHDKRVLSVYALSVSKAGSKLTKSENGGPLLSFSFETAAGGISLPVKNATMAEFASVMQTGVLDRPVVDQTGIEGKYDFVLKWAPDDSQFGGHPPEASKTDTPLPSLFTAMQADLGLKLDAVKAPVDVLVIDHVEKPSEN